MPTLDETTPGAIQAAPSAALELMWLLHFVEAGHGHGGPFASLEPLRQRFGPELTRLRGDGMPQYSTELVVLAYRSGTLMDLDLDRFFARAEEAAGDGSRIPSLLTESPAELEVARGRLQRLGRDVEFRRRYLTLLTDLWSAVADEWAQQGRPAVIAEARRWARAIGEGAPFRQVLETASLWPTRPELDAIADTSAAKGKLILTPCWFGGKIHVLELDGAVYAGRGIRHREQSYKKIAADISGSIKALADPTRLAILLRLAREPASVTEVAREFNLAQPTVSAHVQVLREAGLIEERSEGRSAKLSASEQGVRRLFAKTEESLLWMFRS